MISVSIFIVFHELIFVFERQRLYRETKRDFFATDRFPRLCEQLMLGQAEAQSLELILDHQHRWQETSFWRHVLLPCKVCTAGTGIRGWI